MKQVSIEFVACNQSAEVLQPTDGTFDFPASAIASQLSAVLGSRLNPVASMRAHQFNAAPSQPSTQQVTVRSRIVDQAAGLSTKYSSCEQRLNKVHFMRTRTGCINAERETLGIDENHDLGSLAPLRLADLFTPFFAGENVPSAIASSWFTRPWRSSKRVNRAHAFSQMPSSVHRLWRRQHVVEDGKHLGRSFQRAPLRRIHRTPSTQGRDATTGRPPLGPTGDSGNKSAMRFHCSSVSSNSGSIMDPVGNSTARRDRFAISDLLSITLITANTTQWFS